MPNLEDARDTYSHSIAWLATREELPHLLNRRQLFGCGVEIGVQHGEFSETILSAWAGRHLISVDPWLEDHAEQYVDIANVTQRQHNQLYEETRQRLARFGTRSSIWRMTSMDAAPKIADFSLDFVYIDARHDYASVMEDLSAWYTKVRPGGVFAGHDYIDGNFQAGVFGVKSAVDEFFGLKGVRVYPTLMDPPWLTWLTIAPLPEMAVVSTPV
jgi:hypothetical protein